jgi:hypothetical protein
MVQGESLSQSMKPHADASQANPEDTTPWSELYLKVFENDCPVFAANGLLHPTFHRPKPQKKLSRKEAHTKITPPPMDPSRKTLKEAPNTVHGMKSYPADPAWLEARNWTVDCQGLWSNPDPVFQCGSCRPVHARGLCAFRCVQQVLESRGGGIRTGRCIPCHLLSDRPSRSRCTMASKMKAQRYHWVQGESGFEWEITGRTDVRRHSHRPRHGRDPLIDHAIRAARRGRARGNATNSATTSQVS